MDKINKKTTDAIIWSFVERFGYLFIQFITNLTLARLLSPYEFGQIGLIMVFIALSLTFIDGGFGAALIQKKNPDKNDYSTVFIINICLAILLYCFIFIFAPTISIFFNMEEIDNLLKVIGIILIVDSIAIVQNNILIKNLDFKLLAKIKVVSALISCVFALFLAYFGFGVWSLVCQYVVNSFIRSLLLWKVSFWKPNFLFSTNSFKELFGFGSKLLTARFMSELYIHLQSLIIGKTFTPIDLGFYTQAKQLQQIPVQSLGSIVNNVTFPVFSNIQDDIDRVRRGMQKSLKSAVFINFPLMIFLSLISKPLIVLLYSEKWLPSVPYFQVLCLGFGMFLIVHSINLSLIKSLGRSDWVLKLEIIKKITGIFLIYVGVSCYGIMGMLYALALNSILELFLNGYYTGKLIDYGITSQISDFAPTFLIAFFSGIISWTILSFTLYDQILLDIIISSFCYISVYLLLAYIFKIESLMTYKNIILNHLLNVKNISKDK
jgi:O-antigen/teichoic acid export membrane protein